MRRAARVFLAMAVVPCVVACAGGPHPQAGPSNPPRRVAPGQRADSVHALAGSLDVAAHDARTREVSRALSVQPAELAGVLSLDVVNDSILRAMMRTAVTQNRDLLLARARIDESRALAGIARAPRLPAVSLNGGVGTTRATLGTAAVAYDAWRATADLGWELDLWGRVRSGVRAARADLEAQQAGERALVVSIVSEVALDYLQLLELDAEYDIAMRTQASRRATLGLAQARYERGVVSELDVQQFAAQLAVPAARLAQVAQQRALEEHALNVLLGDSPTRERSRGSLVSVTRTLIVPDSVPMSRLENRPDVAQSAREYAAAMSRVSVAAAERMPPLAIVASAGTQAATPGTMLRPETEIHQLQIGVSVPLFTGGRSHGELAAARARAQQAKVAYDRTRLRALREAADALSAMHAAHDEVSANETLETALRRALELSRMRYASGVANLLEVLDAQRGVFDAELTLAQARFREVASAVQLYAALGGTWIVEEKRPP